MNVLVIVPARGGSKGIPGKNLQTVAGISLLGRAVLTGRQFARRAGLDAVVLVDTDSEEIAREGTRWGAEVPFLRPAELALDSTPTEDNVCLAVDRMSERMGPIDAVVLLQPTSPLRTADDVLRCWEQFDPSGTPAVVSVSGYDHPIEYAVQLRTDGTFSWASASVPRSFRRQDHPEPYSPNGAVYVATPDVFERRALMTAGSTKLVPMPRSRSLDVDTPDDLALVRAVAGATTSAEVTVGPHRVGAGSPCFVVADLGGLSTDVAAESIGVAAEAGVDAVLLPERGADLHDLAAGAGVITLGSLGEDSEALYVQLGAAEASAEALLSGGKPVLCACGGSELVEVVGQVAAMQAANGDRLALLLSGEEFGVMTTARFVTGIPAGWIGNGDPGQAAAAVAAGAELLTVPGKQTGETTLRNCIETVRRVEAALGK